MGCLYNKGLFKYEDKICQHWPEFAQNGKENITIADLMRHESGLAYFSQQLHKDDMVTENIKKNKIGEIIEKDKQAFWNPKYPREYHDFSRGMIANEIFRRIEPDGRTMGEYMREEIHEKMGIDIHCGLMGLFSRQR